MPLNTMLDVIGILERSNDMSVEEHDDCNALDDLQCFATLHALDISVIPETLLHPRQSKEALKGTFF
jgi:hypothetical protein